VDSISLIVMTTEGPGQSFVAVVHLLDSN